MKNQNGSINLITVIFLAIIISTVLVSVNITYLYIQRQNLQDLIDQTALLAAQEIDLDSYYQKGLSNSLQLDKPKAEAAAKKYLVENSKFDEAVKLDFDYPASQIQINAEVLITPPFALGVIRIPVRASAGAQMVVGF